MPNFTKKEIKKSFLKLLDERPLSSITIKDIVDDCKINRSSFYYHFQDIPSLLEEIIYESADALIRQYPSISSAAQCLDAMMQYLQDQRRMTLHVYRSLNRDIFEKQLIKACHYVVSSYTETALDDGYTPEERSMFIQYFKYLLLGFALDWLDSGLDEEKANQFRRILRTTNVAESSAEESDTVDKSRESGF